MGQQQLLLLVIGIILVALAILTGISTYTEHQKRGRTDVATAKAIEIVGRMQVWARTPAAFGGPTSPADPWASFSVEKIGMRPDGTCALNNRPYVRLPDGSQLAILVDPGNTAAGGILAWLPGGNCESTWQWAFHVLSPSVNLAGIQFIGCRDGSPSWANGSQCAAGW